MFNAEGEPVQGFNPDPYEVLGIARDEFQGTTVND